jgi:hypothetical protein
MEAFGNHLPITGTNSQWDKAEQGKMKKIAHRWFKAVLAGY